MEGAIRYISKISFFCVQPSSLIRSQKLRIVFRPLLLIFGVFTEPVNIRHKLVGLFNFVKIYM